MPPAELRPVLGDLRMAESFNAPSTQTSDRFDSEADARAAGHKFRDVIYLRGIGKVRLR
jgi:hypothetical protein